MTYYNFTVEMQDKQIRSREHGRHENFKSIIRIFKLLYLLGYKAMLVSCLAYSSNLKMEVTWSLPKRRLIFNLIHKLHPR
jgi:hypothetical protein